MMPTVKPHTVIKVGKNVPETHLLTAIQRARTYAVYKRNSGDPELHLTEDQFTTLLNMQHQPYMAFKWTPRPTPQFEGTIFGMNIKVK